MARYTGAVKKKKRRFKLLPESPVEGQKGRRKRRRRKSDYGIQLEEKQKLRFIYGVQEKQFRRYYEEARKNQFNTAVILLQLLERRLDNVVYRLGFAATRPGARQLVNHGHIKVNDQKVDIPSYLVKEEEVITLKDKSMNIPGVQESLEKSKKSSLPAWLIRKASVGMVESLPGDDDIRSDIDIQLIIEYYSR